MNLDRDHTVVFYVRLGFRVVDRLEAIDPKLNALALALDFVLVPIVALEHLVYFGDVGFGEDFVTARFIVKAAPPGWIAHVGLVTANLVVVRNPFRTDLNSGIGTRATEQFELQGENKIGIRAGRAEKFVPGNSRIQRSGDDRSILNAKSLIGVAFPILKSFAVEKGDGLALLRGRGRRDEERRE